eukprot:GFUD01081423.1.p1 GENE.GFUD01081423.1~~GFUD01081423.1.p1  ORF type:complete len:548 (-),score=173.24 GFUD01081423.1:281-1924(-)
MNRDKIPRAYDLNARREREFKRQRSGRDELYRREDYDNFQPVMMTFKAFLSTQDDSITDEEALQKYGEYKLEFQRQQLNEFFVTHKEDEWFKMKYHPTMKEQRLTEMKEMLQKRLHVFTTLVNDEFMNDVALDETNQDKLIELMDKIVVLLEGGSEEDIEEMIANKNNSEETKKQIHKTTSIFLSNLHPSITKLEIETIAKKFPGYMRLALSEPDQNNKFARKCWLTFERNAKIREICFGLNNMKIREHDLKPVVNKDLSKRIRIVDKPSTDSKVAELSITTCEKLIKVLDKKAGLFDEDENKNPLLDHIVEGSSDTKVLDRLILYLRIVFSLDFYNKNEYPFEDEMPNRCGLLHVRPSADGDESSEKEIAEYVQKMEDKMSVFLKEKVEIKAELLSKLGLRNENDEIEKFMSVSMQEIESDKWLCILSQKKFKAPQFVRKHIENKFGEKIDDVKMEVEFFNNYIMDENRPKLPVATPMPMKRPHPEKRPAPRYVEQDMRNYEPPAKKSIKDRLGVGGVKVTYSAPDPRDIIDYSDVDSFANFDYDF